MEFDWRPRTRTKRIIVHCSHLPRDGRPHAALMQAKAGVMGLLAIGYHLVIERDGLVVEGRPVDCIGSHTPGCNHDSVGVCLAGIDTYTVEQLKALGAVLAALCLQFPGVGIFGHTELQRYRNRDLTCPAGLDMEAVREAVLPFVPQEVSPVTIDIPTPENLTPQNRLLVEYLKSGRSLSTMVAITSLGVFTLSKRIAELRAMGLPIHDTWATDHHGRRYKKYTLAAEA